MKEGRAEQLRQILLAAVSGATVLTASCAGRSVDDGPDGAAGEERGATTGGSSGSAGIGSGGGPVAGSGGTPTARPPYGCKPDALWSGSANLQGCEGNFVHRTSDAACPLPPRDGGEAGAEVGSACATDADCTRQPNGYCWAYYGPGATSQCHYACETDADCGVGRLCSCEGGYRHASDSAALTLGRCVDATCSTDADCAAGLLCISPLDAHPCMPPHTSGFHCQAAADECSANADCGPRSLCTRTNGRFACIPDPYSGAACGRPFLVRGVARVAELTNEAGWSQATPFGACPELSPKARACIAEHYVRAGLMEHASIAAFARFSLQLLALGAPASIVEASARALGDETRHARLCFGLAARYAGREVAPGPLDVGGALDQVDLLEVVRLVIDEGCVGESVAALEAHAAADLAVDPSVKYVLATIAADETRHAVLAFRFVAWASKRDARVLGVVRSRLATLAASVRDDACAPPTPAESDALLAHGVLDPAAQRAVHDMARRQVVVPALRALVSTEGADDASDRALPRQRASLFRTSRPLGARPA